MAVSNSDIDQGTVEVLDFYEVCPITLVGTRIHRVYDLLGIDLLDMVLGCSEGAF